MTRVTVSIEVDESVSPDALGTSCASWIRDAWDGHGEPFTIDGKQVTLHLRAVKAQPPASGRNVPFPYLDKRHIDCDCSACLPATY